MKLVISDAHEGLKSAINAVMLGAAWQRCRVHFVRNALAKVPRGSVEMVAAAIRTIFAQPTAEECSAQLDKMARMLGRQFPKVGEMLIDAKPELLAFSAFPQPHWRKLWSTNGLERVNKEIKRRTNVVGIFPNEGSVMRLAGAVLMEIHDEWAVADKRYLSQGSMEKLYETSKDDIEEKEVEKAKHELLAS